jgi:hypothetical protein
MLQSCAMPARSCREPHHVQMHQLSSAGSLAPSARFHLAGASAAWQGCQVPVNPSVRECANSRAKKVPRFSASVEQVRQAPEENLPQKRRALPTGLIHNSGAVDQLGTDSRGLLGPYG